MKEKYVVDFKTFLNYMRSLFKPTFGVMKLRHVGKYDLYGKPSEVSYSYIIYKRNFIGCRKYLDFYEYQIKKVLEASYNGEVGVKYIPQTYCATEFDSESKAQKIIELIKEHPERFYLWRL